MSRFARSLVICGLGLWPVMVAATAPDSSPRPSLRSAAVAAPEPSRAAPARAVLSQSPRPVARDGELQVRPTRTTAAPTPQQTDNRPQQTARSGGNGFLAALRPRRRDAPTLCGVRGLVGAPAGDIPGSQAGCGVEDAVRITEVSNVRLSRPALMDCQTAQALSQWVEKGVKPTFRRRGPVVEMTVAAHYVCRTRNHRPGARISEHGKGRAIDISAFVMLDGEVITVRQGWNGNTTRSLMRAVHKSACGPFGTVLGPNSDRYHVDHFHLDTARHRSGTYCR